ncbi:MAG TPA: hypothetical protein VGH19_11915 [Verrucomicrobiae bacterium]
MLKSLRAFLLIVSLGWLAISNASAHVGSPNLFYEGTAAGVPVRVIIKPPGVIPGLAEVTVRTEGASVQKVTMTPVYWETGKKGSPAPEDVPLVRGETNLYSSGVWFMKLGAYSMHIGIETANGKGEVVVPVNSLATVRNPMPSGLGIALICLGLFLFASFITIIGAAAAESTHTPGEALTQLLLRKRRIWTIGAAIFMIAAVAKGKQWWASEDSEYYAKRISRTWPSKADVKLQDDRPVLNFSFEVPDSHKREWSPLILDHGKWSHFFLVREPKQDVLVHLHPYKQGDRKLAAVLPPLPEGTYHLYADLSHENGLYRTLHTEVKIPAAPEEWSKRWTRASGNPNDPFCSTIISTNTTDVTRRDLDMDDAWHIEASAPSASASEAATMNGLKLKWDRPAKLIVNQDVSLRFNLRDTQDQPAALEPYLGMNGHLVVRCTDGSVFIHVHPVGNISMASQAILTARSENPKGKKEELLTASTNYLHKANTTLGNEVSFPYAFPQAGTYRLWVQFKHQGQILTGSYLAEVTEK